MAMPPLTRVFVLVILLGICFEQVCFGEEIKPMVMKTILMKRAREGANEKGISGMFVYATNLVKKLMGGLLSLTSDTEITNQNVNTVDNGVPVVVPVSYPVRPIMRPPPFTQNQVISHPYPGVTIIEPASPVVGISGGLAIEQSFGIPVPPPPGAIRPFGIPVRPPITSFYRPPVTIVEAYNDYDGFYDEYEDYLGEARANPSLVETVLESVLSYPALRDHLLEVDDIPDTNAREQLQYVMDEIMQNADIPQELHDEVEFIRDALLEPGSSMSEKLSRTPAVLFEL